MSDEFKLPQFFCITLFFGFLKPLDLVLLTGYRSNVVESPVYTCLRAVLPLTIVQHEQDLMLDPPKESGVARALSSPYMVGVKGLFYAEKIFTSIRGYPFYS